MTGMIARPLAVVKGWLRQFPLARAAKRTVSAFVRSRVRGEATTLNLVHTFPLFTPYGAGSYDVMAPLTLQSINQTLPALQALASALGKGRLQRLPIQEVPSSEHDRTAAAELKRCLDRHGSDKATNHDYHLLYGRILADRAQVTAICEIGLGSNNTDVASNMGPGGRPGASLRAFRDFLPSARIFGADVDRRILFTEDRIQTFWVDQTDPASLKALAKSLPDDLDMFIDDGLHSPSANLATLRFALPKIRVGGWMVVEDVALDAFPVWEVVAELLPASYDVFLVRCEKALVFAVQRRA